MIRLSIWLFFTTISLSACSRGAPVGQVLATVDGEEITVSELRAEADARNAGDDPDTRKRLLWDIVDRRLLVREARRLKLDQQISYLLDRRRVEEKLLSNLLLRTLTESIGTPSKHDTDVFLRSHPTAFTKHTVYDVEQIDIRGDHPRLADQLKKTASLNDVDHVLATQGIVHQHSRTQWDGSFMSDDLATLLEQLPPGRPFLRVSMNGLVAANVLSRRVKPYSYEDRIALIHESLRIQSQENFIRSKLKGLSELSKIQVQSRFVK
ncbi:hypothetical protein [Sphingomonas solaris]|uniref:Peptidyl-prolyl cis-trans isomerase, EpsD family n=1 Tax=Alterirhizorhabdus solaris TaxID=2529389 RepID=A0A558QXT7_9SPHN|nr:hypothetical protein [Sphingomonas solaris]TVV71964.1 hypothetical protein FOY91_15640 [Sphingomonas solaris]